MSRLDEFQHSLEQMSTEELLKQVRNIRSERKIRKPTKRGGGKKARSKRAKAKSEGESIRQALANMSIEEKRKLLEQLKGKG